MQLRRKNIVILSMILLLFVVAYAYNMFTSSKYISSDLDSSFEDTGFFSEDMTFDENGEPIIAEDEHNEPSTASEDYNPFQQTSSVAIVENKDQAAIPAASSSFFSEYRLERDKNRSREVEMWQDIINNQNSEENFKELAQKELVNIVALTEKEMIIENLIKARGFSDALVFLTDDSATVIVETKELSQADVAQIQDILVRKTKFDPINIKIMTKN